MASLGKFGTPKPASERVDTTFDWFDVTIHLSPRRFSELEFIDLMETASSVDERDPAAATLIKRMLRMLLPTERSAADTAALHAERADLQTRLDRAADVDDIIRLRGEVTEKQRQIDEGDPYAGAGFETFWRVAIDNEQGVEDLMAVYTVLMEAMTNRPTQKPSGSSDGQRAIPATSPVDSSSEVASSGRPDLQVMRQDAEEQQRRLAAVAG